MSIAFNDTSTKKGLVQFYEREIGLSYGDISGDTNLLKEFTANVNESLDEFWRIALEASGRWNLDDSNHTTKFPVIYANLVAGQRAYNILSDADSNLALDFYKVFILTSATGTLYEEIFPVDQQTDVDATSFNDGVNAQGVPYRYDKTGMTIYLDNIPSYSATNGIKVLINREPSYFTYTDTTRKAGVPGHLHSYFYLKPAYKYARIKNLASYNRLGEVISKLESEIKAHFGMRSRDESKVMRPRRYNHE